MPLKLGFSFKRHPIRTETDSAGVEEHGLLQTQAQNTESPVAAYPELVPQEWTSGLSWQERLADRNNDFTEEQRADAWTEVDKAVKTYSDEMIQRWNEEMDNLLVYAGLFSAVLTAFNVESYSLLSPTAPDPVLAALTQISAQLGSFSVHNPFVNSTQPVFQPSSVPSNSNTSPPRWVVWLNAFWFSSLICSLSAASIAIMVKQWIHAYKSGISGTSRHTAHLRQHRYNGLVKWKVAAIIAILPVLLQIALGLFLAGLLVLLWNLNRTVAIVASTLVGALLAFTLATIILPTFTSNCAYLCPLSTSLFRLRHAVLKPIWISIIIIPYFFMLVLTSILPASQSTIHCILKWFGYVWDKLSPPSVYAVQSAFVTKNLLKLDQDVFVTAYSTTGDMSLLEHASTFFSGHTIGDTSGLLTRIHTQNKEFGQPAGRYTGGHWTNHIPVDMASDMLLVQAYHALQADPVVSGHHTSSWTETMEEYLTSSHVVSGAHRISSLISNFAVVLYNDGKRHPDDFPMYECLSALSRQMDTVKEPHSLLTVTARRRVIAAIATVLRTRHASSLPVRTLNQLKEWGLCFHILMSCTPPSASLSQPGGMAEEDTMWTPLADTIAMAENAVTRTLHCLEFRVQSESLRCIDMNAFFENYQDIGLEQLASRVSEKMLGALESAVGDLVDSELVFRYQKPQKLRWLEWLKLLRMERDRQASMQAPRKDEKADGRDEGQDAHEHEHRTGHEHAYEAHFGRWWTNTDMVCERFNFVS